MRDGEANDVADDPPRREADREALELALATWPDDVTPKIHYSTPKTVDPAHRTYFTLQPLSERLGIHEPRRHRPGDRQTGHGDERR
ncbi:hypothetical protein OJ997_08665 [Solirubrobacter phytolaccae]|uniref:Uncharacterized protein n=1 Tax=Solirubrobacter phytolaccae TaxID=1404360 RepID=A0A9X3S8J0_9ACTN|nr:hypothetical protein [Solirubrobacter phytolaccae]MDA0180366.1 hypothetical protein [Solirubrobacter phytolaccae]